MATKHIDLLLELRSDGLDFHDEDPVQNRSEPRYLFYAQHSTRCYDKSDYTKLVKVCWIPPSPPFPVCRDAKMSFTYLDKFILFQPLTPTGHVRQVVAKEDRSTAQASQIHIHHGAPQRGQRCIRGAEEQCGYIHEAQDRHTGPVMPQSPTHAHTSVIFISITTRLQASDVYDKDVHLKLTHAATHWCESYARSWLRRRNRHGDEDGDLRGDWDDVGEVADFGSPVEEEQPRQEDQDAAISSHANIRESSARKRRAAEVVTEVPAEKRSSKEPRDKHADEGSDNEGIIEFLAAAAAPTGGGGVKFNIRWQGHPNLKTWWQTLDDETAVRELSDPHWWKGIVLELEDKTEKKLGIVRGYHEADVRHDIYLGNGVTAHVSLLRCSLLGNAEGNIAWSVASKFESCSLTDHAVNWSETTELTTIKSDWDGVSFPSATEAKTVVLALQRQRVFAEETEAWSTLAELCIWLERPKSNTIMITKFICEVSLPRFIPPRCRFETCLFPEHVSSLTPRCGCNGKTLRDDWPRISGDVFSLLPPPPSALPPPHSNRFATVSRR